LATPPGTTGGHVFTQPALAARLAQTRIQEARETGADILLTDDPLDTAMLAQHADGMRVENLFEVLAERIADGE
jgi:Fe-S oxidoreductase